MEEFQQMIQERLSKVEEIQNCLKLSAVSLMSKSHPFICIAIAMHTVFGLSTL